MQTRAGQAAGCGPVRVQVILQVPRPVPAPAARPSAYTIVGCVSALEHRASRAQVDDSAAVKRRHETEAIDAGIGPASVDAEQVEIRPAEPRRLRCPRRSQEVGEITAQRIPAI